MATAPHPSFAAAPDEHRWRGKPLTELWEWLNAAIDRDSNPPGEYAWVVLPGGAIVALRRNPDTDRRELLIYRREPFTTPDGPTLWTAEVMTFCREFGTLGWSKSGDASEPKIRLVERTRQESFFGD